MLSLLLLLCISYPTSLFFIYYFPHFPPFIPFYTLFPQYIPLNKPLIYTSFLHYTSFPFTCPISHYFISAVFIYISITWPTIGTCPDHLFNLFLFSLHLQCLSFLLFPLLPLLSPPFTFVISPPFTLLFPPLHVHIYYIYYSNYYNCFKII